MQPLLILTHACFPVIFSILNRRFPISWQYITKRGRGQGKRNNVQHDDTPLYSYSAFQRHGASGRGPGRAYRSPCTSILTNLALGGKPLTFQHVIVRDAQQDADDDEVGDDGTAAVGQEGQGNAG